MLQEKPFRNHPHDWIVADLRAEESYLEKPMFGALGCYFDGRLVLVLCEKAPPWNGLLIPTFHNFQQSLMVDFPILIQHPILKKWLYADDRHEEFEMAAEAIARKVLAKDPRIGVLPQ